MAVWPRLLFRDWLRGAELATPPPSGLAARPPLPGRKPPGGSSERTPLPCSRGNRRGSGLFPAAEARGVDVRRLSLLESPAEGWVCVCGLGLTCRVLGSQSGNLVTCTPDFLSSSSGAASEGLGLAAACRRAGPLRPQACFLPGELSGPGGSQPSFCLL